MLSWRRVIFIYPGLSKSEDLHVVRNLHHYHPLALIEQPSLYVYTVTGRNTWDDDHFLWFLGRAKTVYRDEDYTQVLKHLQAHVPIHEYDEDIQRLAEGGATQD